MVGFHCRFIKKSKIGRRGSVLSITAAKDYDGATSVIKGMVDSRLGHVEEDERKLVGAVWYFDSTCMDHNLQGETLDIFLMMLGLCS